MNSNNNKDSLGNPWLKEWLKRQIDRIGTFLEGVISAVNTTRVSTATRLDQIIIELNEKGRDFEIILIRWTYNGVETILRQMITIKDNVVTTTYYTTGGIDKTAEVEASLSDGGTISYIDSKELMTALVGLLTPKQATNYNLVVTDSGTVPTNVGGSVMNIGDANGTWNGATLKPGISLSWSSDGNNVYDAIAFDATGTEFLIEYSTIFH